MLDPKGTFGTGMKFFAEFKEKFGILKWSGKWVQNPHLRQDVDKHKLNGRNTRCQKGIAQLGMLEAIVDKYIAGMI